MSPEDVSEELLIPTTTLAQWRWRSSGPAWLKVGRHVRYRRQDIDAWLNAQTRGGSAA